MRTHHVDWLRISVGGATADLAKDRHRFANVCSKCHVQLKEMMASQRNEISDLCCKGAKRKEKTKHPANQLVFFPIDF